MKKIDLLKPKFMLRRMLEDNIASFSVDDYFLLASKISIPVSFIERNEQWRKSSDILLFNYKKNQSTLKYFDKEAFDEKVIDYIAEVGMVPEDLEMFPFLLEDKRILIYMLDTFTPVAVNYIKDEYIDDEVLSVLERRHFTFDEELIKKCSSLLNSKRIVKNSITYRPELIKYVENLSLDLIYIVIRSNYVPSLDDLLFNQQLFEYEELIKKVVKEDPSILYSMEPRFITKDIAYEAVKYGFYPSEEYLISHPYFITMTPIITAGIKKDPSLIRYLSEDVYVPINVIDDAMEEYEVTLDDLYKFPRLTTHSSVMRNLPAFYLYGKYVTNEDKASVLYDYLVNGSEEPILEALPFFDTRFNSKVDINRILELKECLKLDINQQDVHVQQRYSNILDKIINGVVNYKYAKDRGKDKFKDIVAVNKYLNFMFSFNSESKIEDCIYVIARFVGDKISVDEVKNTIINFYQIYIRDEEVTLDDTKDFCNRVLNCHKDCYTEEATSKINSGISKRFRISEKYYNKLLNDKRVSLVELAISNNTLDKIGISEDTFDKYIDSAVNTIMNNAAVKKMNVVIDENRLNNIASYFKVFGSIDEDKVRRALRINNDKVISFIVNKFNSVKFKLAGEAKISEDDLVISDYDISKVDFHYNHFDIFDNVRYMENLCQLLTMIDKETLDGILENKELIPVIAKILPLVGVIPEFNMDAFISILLRLDRINFRVNNVDNSLDFMLNNFSKYLELAESYALVGDIDVCAIGKDIVDVFDEHRLRFYVQPYLDTFKRESVTIPPITFENKDFIFESGRFTDPQRLLVGFRPDNDSCIRPDNCAGVDTFNEILNGDNGDLIAVKNKKGELVNRILVIRRGNTAQFILKGYGFVDDSIYTKLALQIMEKSIECDDNLEYIFISGDYDGILQMEDRRLKYDFGHADTLNIATLLVSKSKLLGFDEDEVDLDLSVEPKVKYSGVRREISFAPRNTDIDHLRALNIKLTEDEVLREKLAREFSPFFGNGYKHVICGEDWYLLVTNDDKVEELILPINKEIAYEEIMQVKEQLGISTKKL